MMEGYDRLASLDDLVLRNDLLTKGYSLTDRILSNLDCEAVVDWYNQSHLFRKTILMQRYNMGRGEYRYFGDPLPLLLQELRAQFYRILVPIAREWSSRLRLDMNYPEDLSSFLGHCETHGQRLPTLLLLKYGPGDYNCLHQDLYGEVWFPFQVILGLSDSNKDYEGGELVLTKQRPRLQTIPSVIKIPKGQAVVTSTHYHPEPGKRGYYRAVMRHGVAEVRSGERFTLGLIFHNAPGK